ncbi:MAG: 2-C-methyl-D-erythritol 2,4-cyclodiphosphate synthase [Deltaproteobacteria bacterium]|nr:2-C-methyl-D-erythritol 2,4-cyclodiphosphate synthase [Deltaproteobacteria bacterium]
MSGAPRIGFGYDIHRLVPARPLVLGGVTIPHTLGLEGHSDADALLHAITDAVLGACGLADIGTYFPPTDARYKDADSSMFVAEAVKLAGSKGYRVGNCDCMILAERPKLSPHIADMREKIATLLGVQPTDVGVKATTCEGLGFVGREEGIAAHAVVLLVPR